jgi:Erv1 / Alr family
MPMQIKYKRQYKTTSAVSGSLPREREPTVPRRDIFRECWLALHNYALSVKHWNEAAAKQWFTEWLKTVPDTSCGCQKSWDKILEARPPDFSSALAFFTWSVAIHNDVNEMINKPILSLHDAFVLYGWP